MTADRLLSPQWAALVAPLADRAISSKDRISYTFRLFDFDLRLTILAYAQSPASIGLCTELRPAGGIGKVAAIAKYPVKNGWLTVVAENISQAAEIEAALDRLARKIEGQNDIAGRRSRQMGHRI